jgi:putative phosphoribosyl transferase
VSTRPPGTTATSVEVPVGDAILQGDLIVPEHTSGIVLFAHGTGSSRRSPRNRYVAETLHEGGIATLLMDLLTPEEEDAERLTAEHRFDIQLLARRLIATIDWLDHEDVGPPRTGLFGASTGAAAALVAATQRPDEVAAIVSRGGRPDLAGTVLAEVRAPTLLIVGGADEIVLELNRWALEQLRSEKQLVVVPRATHLFEEPGALDEVARLATEWFLRYISPEEDGG